MIGRDPARSGILGLLAMGVVFAATPLTAAVAGQLSADGAWFFPWLLVVSTQLGWCALESERQPPSRGLVQPCGISLAQGIAALAVVQISVWSMVTEPASLVWGLAAMGLLVIGAGVLLRLRAIADLGERFRDDIAVTPGLALQVGGAYSKRRHPSELGLLAILVGTAIVAGSAVALGVVLLVCLPLSLWRCRREDQLLVTTYGPRAKRYVARTSMW